jgi:hypothetical protein
VAVPPHSSSRVTAQRCALCLPRLPEWYDRLVGLCLLKSSNLCLNKLKNRHRVHGGIIVHDYFVTILEKVLSCCIPPRQKSFPGSV